MDSQKLMGITRAEPLRALHPPPLSEVGLRLAVESSQMTVTNVACMPCEPACAATAAPGAAGPCGQHSLPHQCAGSYQSLIGPALVTPQLRVLEKLVTKATTADVFMIAKTPGKPWMPHGKPVTTATSGWSLQATV